MRISAESGKIYTRYSTPFIWILRIKNQKNGEKENLWRGSLFLYIETCSNVKGNIQWTVDVADFV